MLVYEELLERSIIIERIGRAYLVELFNNNYAHLSFIDELDVRDRLAIENVFRILLKDNEGIFRSFFGLCGGMDRFAEAIGFRAYYASVGDSEHGFSEDFEGLNKIFNEAVFPEVI